MLQIPRPYLTLFGMISLQTANLTKVKVSIAAGAPPAEIAAQLIGMIDQLVADCRLVFYRVQSRLD